MAGDRRSCGRDPRPPVATGSSSCVVHGVGTPSRRVVDWPYRWRFSSVGRAMVTCRYHLGSPPHLRMEAITKRPLPKPAAAATPAWLREASSARQRGDCDDNKRSSFRTLTASRESLRAVGSALDRPAGPGGVPVGPTRPFPTGLAGGGTQPVTSVHPRLPPTPLGSGTPDGSSSRPSADGDSRSRRYHG